MKPIARHILKTISILSLLLLIAMAILWARSYFAPEHFELRRGREYFLGSSRGVMVISIYYIVWGPRSAPRVQTPMADKWTFEHKVRKDLDLSACPLGWNSGEMDISNLRNYRDIRGWRSVGLADWWLVIAFAAVSAGGWAIGRKGRALSQPGLCRICGYDLRATADRCPECGTATAAHSRT